MADNSWPAVVSQLIKTLGSATPYFVIVLMAGWGFLEFQKIEQKKLETIENAQNEAQEQYRSQIDTLNTSIRDSYKEVSEISSKQIKNVRDLITLYDEVKEKVSKLQREAQQHEQRANDVRTAAQQEADKALKEADAARAEVAKLNDAMTARQAELERREAELQAELRALEDQRKELVVQVAKLKTDQERQQKALADSATQIAQLRPVAATGTGDTGGPTVEQNVQRWLAAFAEDPKGPAADELNGLIGLDVAISEFHSSRRRFQIRTGPIPQAVVEMETLPS